MSKLAKTKVSKIKLLFVRAIRLTKDQSSKSLFVRAIRLTKDQSSKSLFVRAIRLATDQNFKQLIRGLTYPPHQRSKFQKLIRKRIYLPR